MGVESGLVIDLAASFNPLGPPPGTGELARKHAIDGVRAYADYQGLEIRSAAGQYLDVDPGNIVHGSGSTEIIFNLPRLFPQDSVVALSPTFWEYKEAARVAGKKYRDFSVLDKTEAETIDIFDEMLDEEPAVILLCNPNNPTSTMLSSDSLKELAKRHPDSDFAIDETYAHFREDFDQLSLSQYATDVSNVHVVHSLSKIFAAPGLRTGLLVSDENTIERYKDLRTPYTGTWMADKLVPWLLSQEDYLDRSRRLTTSHSLGAYALLVQRLGERAEVIVPSTIFAFVRMNTGSTDSPAKSLRDAGILVRDGGEWGPDLARSFRFCLSDLDVVEQVAEVLQKSQ